VLLFLMVLSVLLLPLFEVEANRQAGTYYGDRIFGAITARVADVVLGANAGRPRLCNGVHPLSARSKRLSNVRPARARGGTWLT
jgi:hypothetical protein